MLMERAKRLNKWTVLNIETVMIEESGRGKRSKIFPLLCQYFLKEDIHETAGGEESKVEAKRGTEETTSTENVKYVPITEGVNNLTTL